MSGSTTSQSVPWFLKVIIIIAALVVLFIVFVDLLAFASAL